MRNIASGDYILYNNLSQFNSYYPEQGCCPLSRCTSQDTGTTLSLYIVFCRVDHHKNSRSLTGNQHHTNSGNDCSPYSKIAFWNDFYRNNCCPANELLWNYVIILRRCTFCSGNYIMRRNDLHNIPYTKQVNTIIQRVRR